MTCNNTSHHEVFIEFPGIVHNLLREASKALESDEIKLYELAESLGFCYFHSP
jgi:hypothetical protein